MVSEILIYVFWIGLFIFVVLFVKNHYDEIEEQKQTDKIINELIEKGELKPYKPPHNPCSKYDNQFDCEDSPQSYDCVWDEYYSYCTKDISNSEFNKAIERLKSKGQ